jgi:hypothetical protein
MKTSGWRLWVAAAALNLAWAVPAQAAFVDFEDVAPQLFSGSSVDSGGFRFTSDGFGFSGVDSSEAFSAFGNAPTNAQGQFLFALNNDGISMTSVSGSPFTLVGFDFAFIPPLGEIGTPGASPGELYVLGLTATSGLVFDVFSFGAADENGNFGFTSAFFGADSGFRTNELLEVAFFGCIYTDATCSFDDVFVPAQFALDNVQVPEPATGVLMLGAIAGLAVARRRRATR